jgi:hypothetical protein
LFLPGRVCQEAVSASENQSNSKEVRQLEEKLRKKEEQLKIKDCCCGQLTLNSCNLFSS